MPEKSPVEQEGKGSKHPDVDCDSEPVPTIPLCAMHRCRGLAVSPSRVPTPGHLVEDTRGASLLVGAPVAVHMHPRPCSGEAARRELHTHRPPLLYCSRFWRSQRTHFYRPCPGLDVSFPDHAETQAGRWFLPWQLAPSPLCVPGEMQRACCVCTYEHPELCILLELLWFLLGKAFPALMMGLQQQGMTRAVLPTWSQEEASQNPAGAAPKSPQLAEGWQRAAEPGLGQEESGDRLGGGWKGAPGPRSRSARGSRRAGSLLQADAPNLAACSSSR